jgi:putative oxidoreductase
MGSFGLVRATRKVFMSSATESTLNRHDLTHGTYGHFNRLCAYLQSPFLLLIRLYWGWQFTQTGWGKLHNLGHVKEFFGSLGIPAPAVMAPAISMLEFVGGILLIVGLGTRLVGLLLTANMLTAYLAGDREALASIFSDPGKFYNADPFTFLFSAAIVLVFGAGLFSLDALIARRRKAAA